jgi:lipoprotein-releasing system permease protein
MSSIVATISRRFLTGKKRNRFLSFIASVSLFGVCLGVAALTVVMSVMEGFETQLQGIITDTHSHVVLYSSRQMMNDRQELEERLKKVGGSDVVAMSPFVFSEVMLAKGSRVVGSLVEGVEDRTLRETTEIHKHIIAGAMPVLKTGDEPGGILVGANLAESLNAKTGDIITIVSPFFEKQSLQPRSRKFRVSGIMSIGMYEYDSKYSMIHIDEARDFFRLSPTGFSGLRIRTKDANRSHQLVAKIEKELGYPYRARDWTELNRNLFYAVRLQKAVIFVILTAIVVVAAFNIMSTLMMMMSEKRKEMSILKAMGLSPRESARVFIRVGLWIGISGAVAGVAIGLLLALILAKTQFIQLPADVYFISFLPVDVRPLTLLGIACCAMIVALLATVYPSYQVASESPVEGLRYE